MTNEECREVARKYFALAVKSNSAEEREQAIVRGEEWMTHWRYWSTSKANLIPPIFDDTPSDPVLPYHF